MWSLISPRAQRISGFKNIRSSGQKDFFNTIGQEATSRNPGSGDAAAPLRWQSK